ncbi:MAG: general secretion pathway protein GspF [Gammaproteobacteria bacterium]|uniref:general secretion pathway protein GspF n=1 Tax=Pseudomaricurvus alcaniphilus TaxID=1166482 RepID=UPI0014076E73|nr:general secretion pathway protein GspF [Pseudomaricurvus alcaniphilus]MBR9912793.1 general secretion pathway protein GspF [Gammaproteobacteria bacterium]NHN37772.1 general secretion pathway protein GspF [Pseudomaricurvus alcaniphilus]
MFIRKPKNATTYKLDQALRHGDHRRPLSRREFIAQGFMAGMGTALGGSLLSLFANPRAAFAALSSDIDIDGCNIALSGAGKIPFICFDLAGGANIAGSNVLVGQRGGQRDFLTTAGYSKQGLPGDRIPSLVNPASGSNDFVDTSLGLAFHSESAMLRGILEKARAAAVTTNGAVLPARSENDTGNNPHNPMYGINRVGADGQLVTLVGSRSSESGGNSMAPMAMINPEVRPTKVDRPTDVTGLVDVGDLVGLFSQDETVAVMESMFRISQSKMGRISTGTGNDAAIKDLARCVYGKSASLADQFGVPSALDPAIDPDIVGANGIFSSAEFLGDGEFRKTASIMKLVVNGFAGAGTVTMGGYDYHTGDRATGELRDLRAGRCIGACLEYAARKNTPLMVYVCSDGSVFSNGMTDESVDGAGKGVWTGDNQQTAASFFLVYNPGRLPVLLGATPEQEALHQQLGYMRPSGDVETASSPGANNVNLLVEMVILNYMALHGEQGNFGNFFPLNGLGSASGWDNYTAFEPIVNGVITNPV